MMLLDCCRENLHLVNIPGVSRSAVPKRGMCKEAVPSGVLIMFATVPLQAKIGITLFKYRAQQLKITDERVKMVNELVQGMRVVKMCAWESALQKRIDECRKQELLLVWKTRFVSTFM